MSASNSASFTVNSSAAVSVALNPLVNFSTLSAPVAPGTALYSILVSPTTWSGSIALSGANAASFAISNGDIVVGSSPLEGGSYAVTVTATP